MDQYTLEELSKIFVKHSEDAKKQREEMIIRWKNEWSSDKVPPHLLDEFDLPSALLVMVLEIDRLKRQVENLEKSFTRMR